MLRKIAVLVAIMRCLFGAYEGAAQDNTTDDMSILALAHNKLYAVSPIDGSSRVLMERDEAKDAELGEIYLYPTLVLHDLSPDGTMLAYKSLLYESLDVDDSEVRYKLISSGLSDIYILNLVTGEQTRVTDMAETFDDSIAHHKFNLYSSLTWSADSQTLYFQTTTRSLTNRVPLAVIEAYDVSSQTRRTLMPLRPIPSLFEIYGMVNGFLIVSNSGTRRATATLYDEYGTVLTTTSFKQSEWTATMNLNPIDMPSSPTYGYGYVEDETLVVLDPEQRLFNRFENEEMTYFSGFFSHGQAETSLRMLFTQDYSWFVTDTEGYKLYNINVPDGLFLGNVAISPDGQTVAFLQEAPTSLSSLSPIFLADKSGMRELDFEAYRILWAPVSFGIFPAQPQG